jgi:hypothetical protein
MATAMLALAILCFAGILWLVWDAREPRKPIARPTVPRSERMPPA